MVSRGGWLALVATSLIAVGPTYAGVGAQSAVTVAPGARVRVVNTVYGRTEAVGRLDRWVGDTVVVVRSRGGSVPLLLERWHRVDVSTARPTHMVRNGLIGTVVGAAIGAAIGASLAETGSSTSDSCVPLGPEGACWSVTTGGTQRAYGAIVGGAYGALAGILTGTASGLIRRDRWRPASRAVSMALGPGMGGIAFRGHVRLGR